MLLYSVDTFFNQQYLGNPANVVVSQSPLPKELMQQLAAKFSVPATAFISSTDKPSQYAIRWFSPVEEILLCGHGTLAAAAVVLQEGLSSVQFLMKNNRILKTRNSSTHQNYIEIDFLANSPQIIDQQFAPALNITFPDLLAVYQHSDAFFVLLKTEQAVREFEVDINLLQDLLPKALVITAPADAKRDCDFVSRYFWSGCENNEDAVTGSAHTGLTPLWYQRLNQQEFVAQQLSQRGGELRCRLEGDRVVIAGQARVTLQREISF